ncbi:MAG: ribonuclease P protein component [Thermodesulfobacteriota bacterium]
MAQAGQGLSRDRRLRSRRQYLALNRARRWGGRPLLFLWRPNGLAFSRLGLTVSRRVAGAVGRNLVKRRLREAFRRAGGRLPAGIDLVVVARPGAAETAFAELSRLFNQALDQIAAELARNYRPRA